MSLVGTKGIYGLMAIYEISQGSSQNPVSINVISKSSGVSKNYLEQLLTLLKNAGIISSIKGTKGGYFLTKTLSELSYYEVFSVLENFGFTDIKPKATFLPLFEKFENELKKVFDKPLSSFKIADYDKFLNYTI